LKGGITREGLVQSFGPWDKEITSVNKAVFWNMHHSGRKQSSHVAQEGDVLGADVGAHRRNVTVRPVEDQNDGTSSLAFSEHQAHMWLDVGSIENLFAELWCQRIGLSSNRSPEGGHDAGVSS
jgi:hypothetical protein